MVLVTGIVVVRQLLFEILGIVSLHKKSVATIVIGLFSEELGRCLPWPWSRLQRLHHISAGGKLRPQG